jgi:hypothetical protein|tara:strand:+ start:8175 stop:8360 length:186 start_codon:yes stop_codon:yes gene_type:complete
MRYDVDKIMELFERTELRPGEEIIDNSDEIIAKELGLKTERVGKIISKYYKDKFKRMFNNK